MADNKDCNISNNNNNHEESSPLLNKTVLHVNEKKPTTNNNAATSPEMKSALPGSEYGWTADGLPLVHGNVVGEPIGRSQWDSGLFACLGHNDEFCSSDLEVSMRCKFNLEGSCEALNRSCSCCGSCVEDELQCEQFESTCDLATHMFCHACALCQEGREIRRRMPHPGFNAQPVMIMIPPGEQVMGRGV